MSYAGGIMTLPFTKIAAGGQGDLQLAVGRTDLSSQEELFMYGNINKWAKYKPVKNTDDTYASQLDANGEWKSTADWWKGRDGQCGLTFTTYPALGSPSSGFLAALLAGSLGWGYDRAAAPWPRRAYDFVQYWAYAPKPVEGVYDSLQLYGGGQLRVQLNENRGNALGLQLSDLTINGSPAGGWYVGILIYKSASQWTFAFSSNPVGGVGDLNVDFSGMTSFAGAVTIVPFLSSVRAGQGIDPGAGIFISADVAPQAATIQPEVVAVTMTINAQWRDALHGRVHYDVNVINNTYSTFTASNMLIALYDGYQNINTRSVGAISIPARSNQELSGTFVVSDYDPSKTYTLVVTSSSQYVSGSKVVDEPRT